ncbi:hypothetical protein ONS96_000953 [Cadophora gregata f. sp. sojae]|nr:hypothetical protein ONS96_000953 [Cadophora gregata f. sp. sojae]
MSDYTISRPSTPDVFAEAEIDNQHDLTNPFEMFEVFPNIFISSWPPHLPSNITHSLNLTTKDSVAKNADGNINHWHAPLKFEGDFSQSLPLILHAISDAVPRIDLRPNPPHFPKPSSSTVRTVGTAPPPPCSPTCNYLEHGEKFDDVEKEILRRLMSGLGAVMQKAEEEGWMYEAEK